MNKKIRKFLSVALCIVTILSVHATTYAAELQPSNSPVMYEITVGNTTRLVAKGEKLTFSMDALGGIKPYSNEVIIEGDAGTLTVWGSGKAFHWNIEMKVLATSFNGYVSGTNLTTGKSLAGADVSGFSGSYALAYTVGNRYSAQLSGTAFFGPFAVAKTGYNSVTWTR